MFMCYNNLATQFYIKMDYVLGIFIYFFKNYKGCKNLLKTQIPPIPFMIVLT